jgi:DNA-binding NarL/FixJ family response regulator
MKATRILVADSLPLFRAGVRNLLARESDFHVTEAGSLAEVMQAIGRDSVDIALIDFALPPLGGAAAIEEFTQHCSGYGIVWGFEPSRASVLAAIRAGAHGFLRKEIAPAGLISALRGVLRGEAPLSRDLAWLMIDALHELDERYRARDRASLLSSREREVLALVTEGARNKQIASTLTISEFTVKRHVQNILHKLELPTRRAAAALHETAFGHEEPSMAAMETV